MAAHEISHGRGGVGNIEPDDTEYVDGAIVRQGNIGTHGDGAYSTGRGGAANIGDKDVAPSSRRADADFVPEAAMRQSTDTGFHTGRGGAANVVRQPEPADDDATATATAAAAAAAEPHQNGASAARPPNRGLADKLKFKLFRIFKK